MEVVTKDKQFKREVRARMEVTGRPYAECRRIVLAEHEAERVDREAEADADKAAGAFERYGTDEAFLASLKSPDASGSEKLPSLEFDRRRWGEAK